VTGESSVRRSVEVEYWVVDREGRLAEPEGLVDAAPGVEREFVEPLLEIKTTPCGSDTELREELFGRLRRVLERAAELDRRLVPLATPLAGGEVTERPAERTSIQRRVVGDAFTHVRRCAGTHVHVEQIPGRVADQLNALTALDPALALLNSAPYARGEYVAPGARSRLYRRWAYADLPHQGRLWSYVDGAEEWDRRLERRYEEFVATAREAGVDRRAVEAHFDPESAVWVPVQRRRTFGTVEWRSPDTALPSRILDVAGTVADVAGGLANRELRIEGSTGSVSAERVVLPEFDAVLGYLDAAIDRGLRSDVLSTYLEAMGFDVAGYEPLHRAVADGEGETVTAERARELRLAFADRLERDVRDATAAAGPV
jgi:hypothetical protein